MRWLMNHAVFRVTSRVQCCWFELMPFFDVAVRNIACGQTRSGTWRLSKKVPTFRVMGMRHWQHLYAPIRVELPPIALRRS